MPAFFFDVESLGTESTSILLSLGMVYYDGESSITYQGLLDDSIFIKFDSMEQKNDYNRTMDKDTLAWWKKQAPRVQRDSLLPSSSDMKVKDGMDILRKWFESKPDHKGAHIWVRGTLDQTVFESLLKAIGYPAFVPYNNYRDIRTALDCFYPNAKNGYLDVDLLKCPDFDVYKVLKHHPVHDSAYDLCMLFAGVIE